MDVETLLAVSAAVNLAFALIEPPPEEETPPPEKSGTDPNDKDPSEEETDQSKEK